MGHSKSGCRWLLWFLWHLCSQEALLSWCLVLRTFPGGEALAWILRVWNTGTCSSQLGFWAHSQSGLCVGWGGDGGLPTGTKDSREMKSQVRSTTGGKHPLSSQKPDFYHSEKICLMHMLTAVRKTYVRRPNQAGNSLRAKSRLNRPTSELMSSYSVNCQDYLLGARPSGIQMNGPVQVFKEFTIQGLSQGVLLCTIWKCIDPTALT